MPAGGRSNLDGATISATVDSERQSRTRTEAVSAGTRPTGAVHPAAIRALQEIGIAHTGRSKSTDEFRGVPFDLVVTVCDDAAENCPVWLGQGRRVHLGFPDPAQATGTEDQVLAAFRAVRNNIARQVPVLLDAQGATEGSD